jgi:hypothetical protein
VATTLAASGLATAATLLVGDAIGVGGAEIAMNGAVAAASIKETLMAQGGNAAKALASGGVIAGVLHEVNQAAHGGVNWELSKAHSHTDTQSQSNEKTKSSLTADTTGQSATKSQEKLTLKTVRETQEKILPDDDYKAALERFDED